MRVFYPNIRHGWRMLLEALAQVGSQLPEGLDRQGDTARVETGRHVDGFSEDVVPLVRRDTKVTCDDRPEMRLDGEPRFPAAVGHEPIARILQLEQRQDAAIDGLGGKHGERGVADELHDAA